MRGVRRSRAPAEGSWRDPVGVRLSLETTRAVLTLGAVGAVSTRGSPYDEAMTDGIYADYPAC